MCLILSQRALRLFSVLFILFTLFCSGSYFQYFIFQLIDSLFCFRYSAIDSFYRREKERAQEIFWRDYSWKFPQHGKGNSQLSLRGTKSPIQDKPKEKHAKILIKLTKTKHKKRILKAAREKQQVTYKRNPICLTAYLSAETLQARGEWQDIFKILKGKNLQPRLLYPARISFKTDGEIKNFSDKQKVREFSTTKPALQQMLNRLV